MRHTKKRLSKDQKAMIRVNQAGEYGAARIYSGQLAVLGNTDAGPVLQEMKDQEAQHLKDFNKLAIEHGVQPTVFQPFWHIAGYALGAATALMGEKAAHACTIAVEETIEEHYQDQLDRLQHPEGEPEAQEELRQTVHKCYLEEIEHKHTAEDHGGREAPGYELLTSAVKKASKLAIWLSTRR